MCPCGCGQAVSEKPRTGTKFDHVPALRQRNVNAAWTDYDPPQHSAAHIDAICAAEHDRRTFKGRGRAGRSDATENARERKREKERAGEEPRKSKWGPARKLQGRSQWPKGRKLNWRKKP